MIPDPAGGGLVCIDIYATFIRPTSNFAQGELPGRQRGELLKISKLSIRRKSHPIRILIEASAGPEDPRQKSRWTQALKYVYGWRQPAKRLKWSFEVAGGIAGSARKYADLQARRKAMKIMTTAEPVPENEGAGQNNLINRQRGSGEIPKYSGQ